MRGRKRLRKKKFKAACASLCWEVQDRSYRWFVSATTYSEPIDLSDHFEWVGDELREKQ